MDARQVLRGGFTLGDLEDSLWAMRKLIQKFAALAYEREISRELTGLYTEFERWQAGEITAADLSERVHRFHQEPSRQVWSRYHTGSIELGLARAIALGIMEREEVPKKVLDHLAPAIAFFETEDRPDE